MEKQIEEKHNLSESIYMSGHGLDWEDSNDIAEQLYTAGYTNLKFCRRSLAMLNPGKRRLKFANSTDPFHVGDLLALNEFDGERKCYTGNSVLVYVDYMLDDKEYVKSGYVILGIKPCYIHRAESPYDPCSMRHDYSVPLATKGE